MRDHLVNPTDDDPRLQKAIGFAREIYSLFEAGKDCSSRVRELASLSGHPIHPFAVDTAFGSVSPETFARQQLIEWHNLPADLSDAEMLEMAERVANVSGDDFQTEYWIACLALNTGDSRISDLFFWPGEYFGDGDNSRELSASEIIATAFKSGGRQ